METLKSKNFYKHWTQEEELQLENYVNQKLNYKEIAKLMGRTYASCQGHAKYLGIERRKTRKTLNSHSEWTPEEEQLLIEKLKENGATFRKVGAILNRSRGACQHRAKTLKIKSFGNPRVYFHDETFWKIPNPQNSYWAGFCHGDCYLTEVTQNQDSCSIVLDLSKKDKSHLEKFSLAIKFDGKIKDYFKKGDSGNSFEHSYLRINSTEGWKRDLENNFGLIWHKEKRKIPNENNGEFLDFCFILGLWDADGSIGLYRKNSIFMKITSCNYAILEWVLARFNKRFKDAGLVRKESHIRPWESYWFLTISGMKAFVFIDFLLKFPVPKLARKWQNPEILNELNNQKSLHPEFFSQNEPLFQSLLSQFQSQSVSNIEGNLCQKN